jgi:superfamily II DNA or RNA helicase
MADDDPQSNDRPYDSVQTIAEVEARLAALDAERKELLSQLARLKQPGGTSDTSTNATTLSAKEQLTVEAKLTLFRRLFRGRDDVYALRWNDSKSGKSGYSPACRYEWPPGVTKKSDATRILLPLTDRVILNHLNGNITIGIYPLLPDDTCWFLAVDFDKATWREDALAYVETCGMHDVPAALERSRSGNGGHIWIFFQEPMPAALARKLGAFLLTRTMERRPDIGLESYDRFFPNQDTMPSGGFGNLIALPLQKMPRQLGNSVFVDDQFQPCNDQIAFLLSVRPMAREAVEAIVDEAQRSGQILGVRMVATDEDDDKPWTAPPSRRRPDIPINGPLPEKIEIVLGNQLYVPKEGLPPPLINYLIRLAAFQNPEFYKAQAMRHSTWDKPRIISCAENFAKHVGMPRGCQDEVKALFGTLGVEVAWDDQRLSGSAINVAFQGKLYLEQQVAADSLLAHDTGVLAATTAFGKTVIGAYLIAERKVGTLILVQSLQLRDQWIERLLEFLDIPLKQIGAIGGGKHLVTGVVDIATVQSLYRKGIVKDIVGKYGHLVVDECHHISAISFEQVARACKARYVTGLSATVVRKDGRHPIIFMQCGPIRYRASAKSQMARRSVEHKVIVRHTAFRGFEMDGDNDEVPIHKLYAAIVRDEERNNQIVQDIKEALDDGRSPLVLTERTQHLELLEERLRSVCANLIILRGGMGTKRRREVIVQIAEVSDDEPRLLLGTGKYIGEGFDDARLDTLFLTMPISWKGTLAQYAGRLHRVHDRKTDVLIYDYADLGEARLVKMHERRLQGYKMMGYKVS